jgi:hypothetical protein
LPEPLPEPLEIKSPVDEMAAQVAAISETLTELTQIVQKEKKKRKAMAEQVDVLSETVASQTETIASLKQTNKLLKAQYKELYASIKSAPTVVYVQGVAAAPLADALAKAPVADALAKAPVADALAKAPAADALAKAPAADPEPKKRVPKDWVTKYVERLRGDFTFLDTQQMDPNNDHYGDCNVKNMKVFIKLVKEIHDFAAFGKLDDDERAEIDDVIIGRIQDICRVWLSNDDIFLFCGKLVGTECKTAISYKLSRYLCLKTTNPQYDPSQPIEKVEPAEPAAPVLQNTLILPKPKSDLEKFVEIIEKEYAVLLSEQQKEKEDAEFYATVTYDSVEYTAKDELEKLTGNMTIYSRACFLEDLTKYSWPFDLPENIASMINDNFDYAYKEYE